MSEIALRQEPQFADPTGGRLVSWAASLEAAHRIGTALCSTSFVPAHFKGKPEEAAAAILYGDEIGLSPTQALQGVYVISGKPALYARTMVAIVLAAGHDIETIKKTDAEVTVRGRRRGSSTWITETWTTARAKKAGYSSNKKYESDPQAMLYSRAAADVCRQVAPDALAGLGYSVEELDVEPPAKVTITRAQDAPQAPARVSRNKAPEPVEPSFDEPVDTETGEIIEAEIVEEQAAPEPVEPPKSQGARMKMLYAMLREEGMTEREDILLFCTETLNREIHSSNDLSSDDAGAVIDALLAMQADRAAAAEVTA
jgi:hypothetical protein